MSFKRRGREGGHRPEPEEKAQLWPARGIPPSTLLSDVFLTGIQTQERDNLVFLLGK